MSDFTLVLGSKNYSSWSMRAGLVMTMTEAPFEEIVIHLNQPDTRTRILAHSPTGKVPVLKDKDRTIWDSLAIAEYLAERFPDAKLWPDDEHARAYARAISSEMHSSFVALRREMPMNIRAEDRTVPIDDAIAADIARIQEIWTGCRDCFSGTGPFLFGDFTIADAMFAPVVSRFRTYGVDVSTDVRNYMDAVWQFPATQQWIEAAQEEDYVSEVYEKVGV